MLKRNLRTTIRFDESLHARIKLLALKNKFSFNKMLTYLLELGYKHYVDDFEKYFENQNKKVVKEK